MPVIKKGTPILICTRKPYTGAQQLHCARCSAAVYGEPLNAAKVVAQEGAIICIPCLVIHFGHATFSKGKMIAMHKGEVEELPLDDVLAEIKKQAGRKE
jgi:hypothetical protein